MERAQRERAKRPPTVVNTALHDWAVAFLVVLALVRAACRGRELFATEAFCCQCNQNLGCWNPMLNSKKVIADKQLVEKSIDFGSLHFLI